MQYVCRYKHTEELKVARSSYLAVLNSPIFMPDFSHFFYFYSTLIRLTIFLFFLGLFFFRIIFRFWNLKIYTMSVCWIWNIRFPIFAGEISFQYIGFSTSFSFTVRSKTSVCLFVAVLTLVNLEVCQINWMLHGNYDIMLL